MMISGGFLKIQPSELKIPFELKRQNSCSMQLTNKTDYYVAFKVKTTNPKKYCVRPNAGVIQPRSTCGVTVTMQAPKELPPDLQCKDKFLIQSVVTEDRITVKDINPEMFNKGPGRIVEEFKLRVVYITANPPSPVPEEDEETSSRTSSTENEDEDSSLIDSVSTSLEQDSMLRAEDLSLRQASATATISKLTKEKNDFIEENKKLQEQLEMLRKHGRNNQHKYSLVFVMLIALLGIAIGLLIKTLS